MQKTLHRLSIWLGFLALGCYLLLVLAVLGLRYWVLPNIDRWREPLQRELSAVLEIPVQLGPLTADWSGRHLRVTVRDASLRDEAGRRLLEIPSLDAVLGWQSLFAGSPRFLGLRADGVELTLRRDAQGRVRVLGRDLEGADKAESGDASEAPLLNWLSQQGTVQFTNARIRWIDRMRKAPPLELDSVSLTLGVAGDEHVFALHARPPQALGKAFALHGRLRLPAGLAGPLSLEQVTGLFHVNVDDMHPAGWSPWLDIHSELEQGEVDWNGWQEIVAGVPGRHVSQVSVLDGVWRSKEVEVRAASAQLYLSGPLSALQDLWLIDAPMAAERGDSAGVARVVVRTHGLVVKVPEAFDSPLAWDDIALSLGAQRTPSAGVKLALDRAQFRNADMDLDLQGSWQQLGGEAGVADIQGRFHRAELAAIARYLPRLVDEDAREWMRHGVLAGRLLDAPLRLKGDLMHFPFGEQPASGDFEVAGAVHGAVIDYASEAVVGKPGWPRLERLEGHARLHRVELTVTADSMQMRPGGHTIGLQNVRARIPNIEQDAVLHVTGKGQAQATAFLSLFRETPLGRLLDGMFEEARGQGRWEVPISLTIPLFDTAASRVSGSVVFDNAGLQLAPAYPPLDELRGSVAFTEERLTAHDLKGRALGGPVSISGGVGKGQKGMLFEGSLKAEALDGYLDGKLGGMAAGGTPYRLALQRSGGGYGMQLDASLEGFELGLPAPISKPAAARRPLRVRWTPATGKGAAVLDIALGDGLSAQFLRRNAGKGGPFFQSGAINLRGKARPDSSGLAVDIQAQRIDIDAWRELAARFEGNGKGKQAAVFPPLRELRLQADEAHVLGMDLERLTFTARQPEGGRWRLDVSSTQTAGTLFWQEKQGRIQGDVEAHFERLAVGRPLDAKGGPAGSAPTENAAQAMDVDDDIEIPAVRLKVDRLRLYGRDVGALSVVGVNEARGSSWKLETLELSGPHGVLKGSGVWRLRGPQRGLRIQANAMFEDLGAYLEQAGFKDLMQGGHGEITGYVEWRGIPWRFERSALYGDLNVDLAKGRLITLGSRSARLLELLSLQSVGRLANLDWNPAGLMRQGFPFDTLQGHVRMNAGVLHSENYRVAGPVGTIVIAGDVDLPKENMDLYAIVAPNLDVSGAAIAAGIALNPIVGLGAFLTQWLLKDPLGKAMAVEYRIRGNLDDPQVSAVDTSTKKR